jgi:sugar O-acyltransferase (sialic acid O-acetyltransferase NeuD family)
MKRFAVFGAGGCGRGVMPFVREQLNKYMALNSYDLVFVDDNCPYTEINGYRVLPYEAWLALPADNRYVSIAIANSQVRSDLAHRCSLDQVEIFQARATNVVELDDVKIGDGAILCPFVTLTSNIRIGKHFHANIYSYVEHDCVIGDYVTFAPGVKCNGNIRIEDHAYIGSGAVIKQGTPDSPLVIGRGAVVGMGAVVTKSVPPNTIVVGNPARPMKKA